MKNVCIVLRNFRNSVSAVDYASVTDAFLAGGYCFSEIRLLPFDDSGALENAVSELRAQAENMAIVADKTILPRVKAWGAEFFGAEFDSFSEACAFTDDGFSAFLLSADKGSSGAEYVKKICIPMLNRKYSARFDRMTLRAVGAGKTLVRRLLGEAQRMSGDKLTYNYIERNGEDVIGIVYDSTTPRMLTDDVLRILTEGLGDTVYALDDTPLEQRLVELLKLRGKKISVAESFTGGGVGRRIVSVPGASEVYFEGLNTYNEQSKRNRLGVSEYTLRTFGAVSDETAYEMAAGLIASGNCDISVATTGLAGPKSDRSELPVGLCYIAVGLKEKVCVYRYRFDGTREEITETAINHALFQAYRQLKNI